MTLNLVSLGKAMAHSNKILQALSVLRVNYLQSICSNSGDFQARIQEFSSGGGVGGVQLSEIFDKKKKKEEEEERNRKKTEGWGGSEVWFYSTFQKIICIQVYFLGVGHGFFLYNCKPFFTRTHGWYGSFDIVNVSGRGVWGSSARNVCLKWRKIISF